MTRLSWLSRPEYEPYAVRNPELARMVAACAEPRELESRLESGRLHEAWRAQRRARARSLTIGGLALAACVALVFVLAKRGAPAESDAPGVVAASAVDESSAMSRTAGDATAPPSNQPRTNDAVAPRSPAQLADAVRIAGEHPSALEVRGPWHVVLRGDGEQTFTVSPRAGGPPLLIETPTRTVSLHEGTLLLRVVGATVTAELEVGRAEWIANDGAAAPIEPGPQAVTSSEELGAQELVRRAERHRAAGKRRAAIRTLRELVARYPESAAAHTGLLDLASLLQVEGRRDAASCAYRLFLERNPKSPLRADVERTLGALGVEPSCRGLSPR